jgi:hypothetical protein
MKTNFLNTPEVITKKTLLYFLFFCLHFYNLKAQNISVDRKEIFIGEQVKVEFSIDLSVNQSVVFPQIGDTIIGNVEVLEKSEVIDQKDESGNKTGKIQTIYITSFDSGFYAIPPFKFLVNGSPQFTEAFLLTVKNVVVDTTKGINDIKENIEEPFNMLDYLKVYWPYIAGGLTLFAIIFYLIYYFVIKEKKPKALVVKTEKVRPLDVLTIEALENLRSKNLHKTPEQLKAYHTELTDIVRDYIEKRFALNAMEKTTDELLHGLRITDINTTSKEKLKRVLLLADLVKFAKEKPHAEENENSINYAIEFVKENTLQEVDKNNITQIS